MKTRWLLLVAVALALGFHVCHRTVQQVVTSVRNGDAVVGHNSILVKLAKRLIELDWDDDPSEISGLVTGRDHEPVAGATVTLDGAHTTTTAADGTFAFEDVDLADHTLVAEKGDDYGETAADDNHVTIELRGGPRVVLHIVDEADAPIGGAKVWGYSVVQKIAADDGTVQLRGLGYDSVGLEVEAEGYGRVRADVPLGDDPRRTIDHRVVLQHAVPIGGVVIDQDGKPVAHAFVYLQGGQAVTAADGTWKILPGVQPGKQMLFASSKESIPSHPMELQIEKGTPRMDLVVHIESAGAGGTITGFVVDASGAPVQHPSVSVQRVPPGMNAWPRRDSDEHGGFSIRNLGAGTYELHAWSPTLAAPAQTVTLERGGHLELRFVVTEPAAISGIVVDDLGLPAAGVLVAPHDSDATATSDATGHFLLGGLSPGSYALETWRYLDLEDRTAQVTAHPGDHDIRLVSPRAGAVTGRVVLNGKPVDYFGMTLTDEVDRHADPVPIHDSDGRFTKTKLGQRPFAISISGPGFEPKVIEHVHVKPGEQLDLGDIAVTSGRVLRGRVVDRSGMPVADAAVVARADAAIDVAVTLATARDRRPGARTDSSGRFELAGLPDNIAGYQIQASAQGALAPPRELSQDDFNRDLELVLDASGSITGRIVDAAHAVKSIAFATTTAPLREYTAPVGDDGAFSLAPLPVGDYVASFARDAAPVAVHVGPGAATALALTVPSQRVGVDAEVANKTCATIVVSSPLVDDSIARPIVSASCSDGHHAAFELAPGEYKLCADGGAACVVADLAAGPRQHVIIDAE